MIQIIFNEISAAEMTALPVELQLSLLAEFQSLPKDLEYLRKDKSLETFGILERDGQKLFRYRARDYRIYFELVQEGIRIHRVLHKNTIRDFLFRSKLPMAEDDQLSQAPAFWELIEQGAKAKQQS